METWTALAPEPALAFGAATPASGSLTLNPGSTFDVTFPLSNHLSEDEDCDLDFFLVDGAVETPVTATRTGDNFAISITAAFVGASTSTTITLKVGRILGIRAGQEAACVGCALPCLHCPMPLLASTLPHMPPSLPSCAQAERTCSADCSTSDDDDETGEAAGVEADAGSADLLPQASLRRLTQLFPAVSCALPCSQ